VKETFNRKVLAGGILLVGLVVTAFVYSTVGLYKSLAQVLSIYTVDVRALSLDGELQYQTQESRQQFLHVLIPALDSGERNTDIREVRQADLQVSLLTGQSIVLTSDRLRLKKFSAAWDAYIDVRDEMIALALQGRFDEAQRLERTRGTHAFVLASEEVRRAKTQLEAASSEKVQKAWQALRRDAFEMSALFFASLLLVGGLLATEARRRQILRQLRASEARFRTVFEEAAVGIVTMDAHGKILSANKAITDITMYSPQEVVGKSASTLLAQDSAAESIHALARALDQRSGGYRAERRAIRKDGQTAWIRTSVSIVRKEGSEAEAIALCEDITEQKLAREQLSHQATHDSLTGLANRRHFEESLQDAIQKAASTGGRVALLYIDLDGFKLVNDTMGHSTGDHLLRQVAARLQSCLHEHEIPARIGGDEFTVVKPLAEDSASAEELTQRILEAFRIPFSGAGQGIRIGASIGVSHFPEDGEDANELYQSADAAMFHAKRTNHEYHVFDASMKSAMVRKLKIQKLIVTALERNEFAPCFQPLYDLETGDVVRFEALCRWVSPELGDVPPSEFIPIAEEIGLITELGLRILREACMQARKWQLNENRPVQIAVNVSALQFARDEFVSSVAEILRTTGLAPELLELEITESVLVRDPEESVRKMQVLRDMGVSLSIDDFGTGYSSLSYLQTMPVNAVKIDRSFTANLGRNTTAVTMIKSVIAMGRTLGLRVVTEGVENAGQLDIIRQLGSHEAQGYFMGRPESAALALERVTKQTLAEVI
jgi:diguanylate cyclase (GGDEF)-like protein/PAS domain S-box-containing protein